MVAAIFCTETFRHVKLVYQANTGHRAASFYNESNQRRIFIFRALGYFQLGALLEGLRRLMSYKLA